MIEMVIDWEWDDLSADGSADGESWSRPPFTVEYEFNIHTSLFDVYVYSNRGVSTEWWNVRAWYVQPKDKEAVGESLLALCEQRYAQENPNG
jgi:hypothetical protein